MTVTMKRLSVQLLADISSTGGVRVIEEGCLP